MKHIFIGILISLLSIPASAATELNFYTWREQERSLWDEINRQGLIPGVTVNTKVILYNSYRSHILLELQNRRADLFQWAPGASNLKPLIKHRFIAPYASSLNNMNASALLASKGPNGQLYGVPFALQLQSIMANQKLLNKHGITSAPTSLSELNDNFEQLKSAGITPMHLSGGADWFVSQLLGEVLMAGLVDEKFASGLLNGNSCFKDSNYVQIFQTLKDWQSSGYLNDNPADENYGAMNNSVALGNSAMDIDGGWKTGASSNFYQVDPDYKFGFWAIPGESAKIYALGDGSYQVGKSSKHRDDAERVLAFTATKKFAELFAEHVNELPAYGGEIYIKPGVLKTMADLVAEKTYPVSLFTAYEINRKSPSYNELLIKSIRDLLNGEKTPQQAANSIQSGLNSWRYAGYDRCS